MKNISYVPHHAIDKGRWDDCIRKSFNGMVYAYSWYLDITCPGWDALITENYVSVMPLTHGSKMGITYLYPPFFIQQLGVFSVDKLSADEVARFLENIPSKFSYWEINLNVFNKIAGDKYKLKPNLTHELDLIEDIAVIRKNYSENHKRNLKKALGNNLVLHKQYSHEEIIALFRSDRGAEVTVWNENHYDILRRLLQAAEARGCLHVRAVTDANGQLLSGAFFMDSNGKVIFLFSGNSAAGKTQGAMLFLIDAFIEENAQRNLILDFEGSNNPDLARFYRGFGAKECVYLQARHNRLPWLLKWYKK
ncbi:MAG: GNAT family N-acetyltransferase [Bacteroidetes bacterium]|jgi:hypothetical protein|nr:GNAT family N-acetyltransferase [Bacteroidota bacterium]